MANEESFQCIIQAALEHWTALRLAVENCDRGTAHGRQMAVNIASEVTVLCQKGGDSNDIADLLEDLLDDWLDTLCEDGSPEEVGMVAVRAWEAYQVGGAAAARALLPTPAPREPCRPLASSPASSSSSRSGSPEPGDASASVPTTSAPPRHAASSDPADQPMELDEENDGWTTIRRKKH